MKKNIVVALGIMLFALLLAGFTGLFLQHRNCYIYLDPNTKIDGIHYISKSVNILKKGFNYAQKELGKEGKDIKYTFYNAYGSGFIKNNPIPNDLDFSVGLHLGEYVYDGTNADEIAKSLVDKIDQFKYFFSIYISFNGCNHTFVTTSPLMSLNESSLLYQLHEKAIADSLDKVIADKPYMVTTQANRNDILVPYLMQSNEILLPNSGPLMLYSDLVIYDNKMPKYIREISIVPEYFFTLKYKGDDYDIEIVPEAFEGERLHLKRRIFAPNVFLNPPSKKYLLELDLLNDSDLFVDYRLLSYRRHLQEISNIKTLNTKPIKIFKRIMQTANILYPLLDKEEYDAICKTVADNLGNRDVQLLNEYLNITGNIFSLITDKPEVFVRLKKEKKIYEMFDVLAASIDELEERHVVSYKSIDKLRQFYRNDLRMLVNAQNADIMTKIFVDNNILDSYIEVKTECNNLIYSLVNADEAINKYIKDFMDIYTKSGFKQIELFWLDDKTIGILKDSNTKNIKDFDKLVLDNGLPIANYKFISSAQIPKIGIRYSAWARFNTTPEEDSYYKNLVDVLKNDMKNYNIKYAR